MACAKAHEGYQRDLNVAAAKLKGLQDENEYVASGIGDDRADTTFPHIPQAFY